ncbi:methyltransferase domain-containing protein [Streptosporangium lutulentum]
MRRRRRGIWLASHGWHVTAADISPAALARAAERAATNGTPERLRWVEADLSVWSPGTRFDLVMTHYAHPAMPQLEFYDRIAGWVADGGTLLIVGHLRTPDSTGHGHGHHPCRGVGHLRGHHRASGRRGVGDRHRRRAPPRAPRPRGPDGPPPRCRRARHPAPVAATGRARAPSRRRSTWVITVTEISVTGRAPEMPRFPRSAVPTVGAPPCRNRQAAQSAGLDIAAGAGRLLGTGGDGRPYSQGSPHSTFRAAR